MGGKPSKSTRADRRKSENKHIPPYPDRNSQRKNRPAVPRPTKETKP